MKIVIIGGGPGGYVAAIRAAQLGAEVTLIENKFLGGTCLNVGCIPTKVLLHTTELLDVLKNDAKELGIAISDYTADWPKLQKRKTKIIKKLVGGVNGLLKNNAITKIMGTAVFVNDHQIKVVYNDGNNNNQDESNNEATVIDFDFAIIATGSKPVIPPVPGFDLDDVITSETALSLDAVPESLCIIGGGVIGCEFASIYNAFGCKVTIIEMLPELIANMDRDIVMPLKNKLLKDGVEIYTSTRVESIREGPAGLAVTTSSEAGEKIIMAQKVLLSVGRKPELDTLELAKAGIETSRGAIKVNQKMQTNKPNIYAVGDCNGGVMLAHVASAEGIFAVETIMGKRSQIDFKTIPYCVYTKPELASVGLTEAQARDQGYEVKVGNFPMAVNGKAMIMGETTGVVKYVTDAATGEILGLHMAGPRATDLIVEGALAIRLEATVAELMATIHAHPTVGEALMEAAHAVNGEAIHLMR
ncbi:MAG: dihydrolipoyl dehydrogenase [Candidatus Wallbacteria bacterium HGW-Wallbacteria-1]|jgi:dihydrolipoamide dehydrogenase|uniref:Dihydrolipoyl dehydrogenase n=1 Tax=Candidatus Wallbacteria bacterium HGW-Wallbacteria-1 TaxID=2013854 RepID=A0A2N1PHX0_9BACT|nr:MAG: dihydrolipoyl dehydrogenase [Candidatus Wallbacteria bacterium HGW-Wallbacteria-1]